MLSVFLANARLPTIRQGQAGDHHLKFYDERDNLPLSGARVVLRAATDGDAEAR